MKITKMKTLILAFSTLVAVAPMAANADRRDGGRHEGIRHDGGRHWHGDIRQFHTRDFPRWRSGNWHHGVHGGRLGWWWVVGGLWYFYPQPVYPYPDAYTPPVTIIQQSPPSALAQNWYYCTSAQNYYPYVAVCPEGWKMVPATPLDVPAQ